MKITSIGSFCGTVLSVSQQQLATGYVLAALICFFLSNFVFVFYFIAIWSIRDMCVYTCLMLAILMRFIFTHFCTKWKETNRRKKATTTTGWFLWRYRRETRWYGSPLINIRKHRHTPFNRKFCLFSYSCLMRATIIFAFKIVHTHQMHKFNPHLRLW